MKKTLCAVLILWSAFPVSWAQKSSPEVSSKFKGGEFITTVKIPFNASENNIHVTMDRFVSEYKNNLPFLFDWAIEGLKLRGEHDEFIVFNLKSHQYDQASNVVKGIMDIDVPFLNKENKNVKYKTTLQKRTGENGGYWLKYEMIECDKVIDHVDALFDITSTGKSEFICIFEAKIRLALPYRLMNMNQYKKNLEWRFAEFISNLRDEAERI